MFQLIVAVISIALVAILAIASIYYGGSAFLQSSTKAAVTSLVNGGQQIAGAQALYKTDHAGAATTFANLLTDANGNHYLTQAPALPSVATGTWDLASTAGDLAKVSISTTSNILDVCNYAEEQATGAAIAGADDAAKLATIDGQTAPLGQFGCYGDGAGAVFFGFKL